MKALDDVVAAIWKKRRSLPQQRGMLIAISGIDGSGKGYVTQKLATALSTQTHNDANHVSPSVAVINIDGWLNLPNQRFSQTHPAERFYHHAIRFDVLFEQLVFPLRDRRSVCIEANYTEETATAYRTHTYQFNDVDIILLEGIYLLKRQFQAYYDFSVWIECSFDTALERAIARAQEGLPPEATVQAYQTIYFPAQAIHFERDRPQEAATAILINDPKLRPHGTLI